MSYPTDSGYPSTGPGNTESLEARFQKFHGRRSPKLERAREHAELTIPGLLPREGFAMDQELPVPYNSLAAEGTMSMASRITSIHYPFGTIPIFQTLLNDAFIPEGADTTEEQKVLSRFDRRVMDQLAGTNLRSVLFTAFQHLIVVGDGLIVQQDDYNFKFFRLDQYVVCRSPDGEWREIIVQEWVNPEYLPSELRSMAKTAGHAPVNANPDLEAIYTCIKFDPDKRQYRVAREFRGNKFETDAVFEVPPYFPIRWTAVSGEDYGRSLIEDAFGDIRVLDALSKALLEGSILNAEHRWGVNPAGLTEVRDWEESVNGDAIPAQKGDIYPIQAENQAQVAVTLQSVAQREAQLGRRFLMNSAVQPRGERVTARQVSILAQELDQNAGGAVSMQGRDLMIPVIRRTMYMMSRDNLLPSDMKELIADKSGSILKLTVRAGIEVLHREAENEKLTTMVEMFRNLPESAQATVVWPTWMERWLASFGIESTGLIKSPEQMAQEQQADMQQQQAMMAQQAAQQVAVQAAGQPQEEQV